MKFNILILIVFAAFALNPAKSRAEENSDDSPSSKNAYESLTGEDSEEYQDRWDRIHNTDRYVYGIEPSNFLKKSLHLLPKGRVLDIAMGEGRNAVFMAVNGYQVDGVDISQVALAKANRLAKKRKVRIKTIHAALATYSIAPESYDVIMNIDFLMRNLIPKIKTGLKKGGVVVFETWVAEQGKNPTGGTARPDWSLKKGELKEIFSDFEILNYQASSDAQHSREGIVARKK